MACLRQSPLLACSPTGRLSQIDRRRGQSLRTPLSPMVDSPENRNAASRRDFRLVSVGFQPSTEKSNLKVDLGGKGPLMHRFSRGAHGARDSGAASPYSRSGSDSQEKVLFRHTASSITTTHSNRWKRLSIRPCLSRFAFFRFLRAHVYQFAFADAHVNLLTEEFRYPAIRLDPADLQWGDQS